MHFNIEEMAQQKGAVNSVVERERAARKALEIEREGKSRWKKSHI